MKTAVYIKDKSLEKDSRFESLVSALKSASCSVEFVQDGDRLSSDVDILLAAGGDGTFLSAARIVEDSLTPVLGVNFGRLGFLSENKWDEVVSAIVSGGYTVESRNLLKAKVYPETGTKEIDDWTYALNEVCVHRSGASMLGVDVTIDGSPLPTYWADGLLVATSSGSTAYSLSAGGPIVLPESKVLIISPISPHNLNVRPLIVPDSTEITLKFQSREDSLMLTMDNRRTEIDAMHEITISKAPFPLKRVKFDGSSFLDALVSKLFWGEDIRNNIKR